MQFFRPEENYKKGAVEVYPEFESYGFDDFLIRGKSFYAIYDSSSGLWSRSERDVGRIIDQALQEYVRKGKAEEKWSAKNATVTIKSMSGYSNGNWSKYKRWLKESPDNWKPLDQHIVFANTDIKKSDYCSHKLPYNIADGECKAWDAICNKLYLPEERQKFEWAIGSVISGDSTKIQKMIVFYGSPGTGKSTILNIISELFEGYTTTFDAKALASNNDSFALDFFETDPLVAIQHDGDLSHVEDNTKINMIVSHEPMRINAKFKAPYTIKPNAMLFMASNDPVRITDARSGIYRRLIDIIPTGDTFAVDEYDDLMGQIPYELGQIAAHCLAVYKELGKNYYNSYRAKDQMAKTNVVYNFVQEMLYLPAVNHITLTDSWRMFRAYCEDGNYQTKMTRTKFREDLKVYFSEYHTTKYNLDTQMNERYVYDGLKRELFGEQKEPPKPTPVAEKKKTWIKLTNDGGSALDDICSFCPAQYANEDGKPQHKWDNVKTKLKDLNTSKLHYTKLPAINLIVLDFDIPGPNGEKDLEANIREATKFPPTYAEVSKSGGGLHLVYWYEGDIFMLSDHISDKVEIKVYTGGASLRRKLGLRCNLPILHISGGLPLKDQKEVQPLIKWNGIKDEQHLRALIAKNLSKQISKYTKPSVDYIFNDLESAYNSGMHYDVSDLRQNIVIFASSSTHQAKECMSIVNKMHFKSDEPAPNVIIDNDHIGKLIFYDIESFSNFFCIAWKYRGEKECQKMINPSAEDVRPLLEAPLVGFNNRNYDNHMIYARAVMNYSNEDLFNLSQNIVHGEKVQFGEAYNIGYTDIYDYCSNANKMSLKKWEIKLGIHHLENAYPWDQPLDKEHWDEVADYCCNDVNATEQVFEATQGDFEAREMLAKITGMTPNNTTNQLTTRLIFGNEKNTQQYLRWRDLSQPVAKVDDELKSFLGLGDEPEFVAWDGTKSYMPYFPGYIFENGVSKYRGYTVGEGGFVYANPGIYGKAETKDVASMHPHSVIGEMLFGPFTPKFKQLVDTRICIKHKDFEGAIKLFPQIEPFLTPDTAKAVANALKTAINSVYGLTAAHFKNPFHDERNVDNIVAKRGALMMIDLLHACKDKGWTVIHIKTDSIKIADPTPEKMKFVEEFGKRYGYTFETEHTWNKLCLVNKAVLIGLTGEDDPEYGEHNTWEAVGEEFAVPYVNKTLFTKDKVIFADLGETKSVSKGAMYLVDEDTNTTEFIGRVSRFLPVKKENGGKLLQVRREDGTWAAVTGSKGYYWKESEAVTFDDSIKDKMSIVDMSYYEKLAEDAKSDICKAGRGEIKNTDGVCNIPPVTYTYDDFMQEDFSERYDLNKVAYSADATNEEEVPFK